MKTEFTVKREGNTRLILIFAGWGSNANLYKNIEVPGWDTLVSFDYDGKPFPEELLAGYTTIYLFAWSLGVAASVMFLDNSVITKRIAINGTTTPVSDNYGIPVAIFNGTEQTLNERNLNKFRLRMAGSKAILDSITPLLPVNPDIEELKRQLRLFKTLSLSTSSAKGNIQWDRVYISDNDMIFPSDNQSAAWDRENVAETIHLDSPHYIDLKQIVSGSIPNLQKVAGSFSKADKSYESHASAQFQIAEKLLRMIPQQTRQPLRILEIGPGSGSFTRLYADKFHPDSITYVDLYPIRRHNLAPIEIYHVGDAEEFIASTDEKWDLILSASTIQWFVNLPVFFRNARRCLTEGGMLCCSTFLPDNLKELRAARPSTLLYPSAAELSAMIGEVFDEVTSDILAIDIEFKNAREALEHLKSTGVGSAHNNDRSFSGRQKNGSALTILSENPTLHYSAFLFTAR